MSTSQDLINRDLTQQDGWKTQDGRMTRKCRARPGMHCSAPLARVTTSACVEEKKISEQDSPRFQAGGCFQLEFAKHSDNWPLGQVCREKNVGPWTPLFLNTKAALPHLKEWVSLLHIGRYACWYVVVVSVTQHTTVNLIFSKLCQAGHNIIL